MPKYQGMLKEAKETIKAINTLHSEITKYWCTPSLRVLGYVVHAPSISIGTGPQQWTEDWALINLDREKIDWSVFKGNVVSLSMFRSIL